MNHILIFDIGKTNKKCFVFDEDYCIVQEISAQLPETTDEDGFPCEDLDLLQNWIQETLQSVLSDNRFHIVSFNCTAYGASFVHLGEDCEPVAVLYNYLKPYPNGLQNQFFEQYGGAEKMALETASPVLGHLNSGLQLYWLKHEKPAIFEQIRHSLHLPQYIASLLSTLHCSEITSIGCHTMLWDFQQNDYHDWVKAEGILEKFPEIYVSDITSNVMILGQKYAVGKGLHDSSAALVPYLACFEVPFLLLSTGTWCIAMNPFNDEPLTPEELEQDCLCYMTFEGKPVKAARYFGGHEHEEAVKKIAAKYRVTEDFYKSVRLQKFQNLANEDDAALSEYSDFMHQLIEKQILAVRLALGKTRVKHLYVDGGFSKNEVYMRLLAEALPEMQVFAAEVAQATALGAALVIHAFWNNKVVPKELIALKDFT